MNVPQKGPQSLAGSMTAAALQAQCHDAGMDVDNPLALVHRSRMSSVTPVGAGALLRQPSLIFFLLSRSLSRFSSQIGAVAIGWQIYDLTGSAFDLGMAWPGQVLFTTPPGFLPRPAAA